MTLLDHYVESICLTEVKQISALSLIPGLAQQQLVCSMHHLPLLLLHICLAVGCRCPAGTAKGVCSGSHEEAAAGTCSNTVHSTIIVVHIIDNNQTESVAHAALRHKDKAAAAVKMAT